MHRRPPLTETSRAVTSARAAGFAQASALACVLFAACGSPSIPTVLGPPCMTDDDCDPGDSCIGGTCQGDSAGNDGGASDGGSIDGGGDAGASDGGSIDGGSDAGSDAGTPAGGILSLAPLSSTMTVAAGTAPAAITLTVSNHGTATLHWNVSCTNGASPSPSSAGLASGASEPLAISLPTWTVGGAQLVSCKVNSSDSIGGPLTWNLIATVTGAPASVTTSGGAVDLLDFAFTGDTRPADCDNASGGSGPYPQAIFESVLGQMSLASPQFGFDLGDHMYVCSGSAAAATAQMKLYTDALAASWPKSLAFMMTMGNHECEESDCSGKNNTDPNYLAYAAALQAVSNQSHPYYLFQVQTRLGLAWFVFIADHYFGSTAQAWLTSTLADADSKAAYTFIIKHYPMTGSRTGPAAINTLITAHHYSMILTAHEHDYAHDTTTAPFDGRSVICGLGGANSSTGDEGFCRVQQRADGSLQFTQYGLTGNPGDTWSVTARQ